MNKSILKRVGDAVSVKRISARREQEKNVAAMLNAMGDRGELVLRTED